MDWKSLLVKLYVHICDEFDQGVVMYTQRQSNNSAAILTAFTDQETITVYLFGLLQQHRQVKAIYDYATDHLLEWFPTLPSYAKFNQRLNRLNGALAALAQRMAHQIDIPTWLNGQRLVDAIVDSFPIIMAKGSRADRTKVVQRQIR